MKLKLFILCTISAVLLSLPWLVPHAGALALAGFVPLLLADYAADCGGVRKFFFYYFWTFILWNALTTFWVCNATVGGGIFAIVANALQMAVIWALFRLAKRHLGGAMPYIFLAVMWIAWERKYFSVDISWPWIVLGNAFARSTHSVQWYEYTGTLGGSLWIWVTNLGLFGMMRSVGTGAWGTWTSWAKISSAAGLVLAVVGPIAASSVIYNTYQEKSEGKVNVIIGQSNFDPYHKYKLVSQADQNKAIVSIFENALREEGDPASRVLLVAPETITADVVLNHLEDSPTVRSFRGMLDRHPRAALLFGASSYRTYPSGKAPSVLARKYGDGWVTSHNSAIVLDSAGRSEVYLKSRLVVGTELTPYPKVFVPLDEKLSELFGTGGLMGRCEGQSEASVLHFDGVPFGCAVCYESIYGEYCTEYVRKGAKMMTVITNDGWWGDTPGYKQHLSYSCLRAIELRRDIARSANTGISCIIDQRGDILEKTPWWEEATISSTVNLNSSETFFVRNGDIAGRVCTLAFLLLAALLVAKLLLALVSRGRRKR